jgi:hypothetical protein
MYCLYFPLTIKVLKGLYVIISILVSQINCCSFNLVYWCMCTSSIILFDKIFSYRFLCIFSLLVECFYGCGCGWVAVGGCLEGGCGCRCGGGGGGGGAPRGAWVVDERLWVRVSSSLTPPPTHPPTHTHTHPIFDELSFGIKSLYICSWNNVISWRYEVGCSRSSAEIIR